MALEFVKYQGIGNDFMVVEAATARGFSSERVQQLCDRHFGVGADGVLVVTPSQNPEARARMVVLNADGSRPEMCGNGLRCVALHLADSSADARQSIAIETDAGVLTCDVSKPDRAGAGEAAVTVGVGRATIQGTLDCEWKGQTRQFTRVSTGNPHAVLFGLRLSLDDIDHWAPKVSNVLSGGANIEFAQIEGDQIRLIVWERGVGRTLACGTGACAAVAAAVAAGQMNAEDWVKVLLPGGALHARVDGAWNAELRGPAKRVFAGQV